MGNSLRRWLLICALLIAIPFQAVASSVLSGCELTHGLKLIVSMHGQDSHVDPDLHVVNAEVMHASTAVHHHMDPVAAHTGDHHPSGSDSHNNHLKHTSCCSSSASGAVTSDILFLASARGSRVESTYISILYLPPFLAGLDRPPQRPLV